MHRSGPTPAAGKVEYTPAAELMAWLDERPDGAQYSALPAVCSDSLGFFLFLRYSAARGDLASALFVEAVAEFKVSLADPPPPTNARDLEEEISRARACTQRAREGGLQIQVCHQRGDAQC